jgi:hypothetical protein
MPRPLLFVSVLPLDQMSVGMTYMGNLKSVRYREWCEGVAEKKTALSSIRPPSLKSKKTGHSAIRTRVSHISDYLSPINTCCR